MQSIHYARTADFPGNPDPAVTNYFTYTPRGDLSELADAAGRRVRLNHDAVGRIQWRDVLDESSNAISHEAFYYNRNGDLEWYDGPRSNPDDYVWFNYDGAGRKVQEIHWRSRAKADGTGVEAETGDNLYATSFSSFDAFGNLTRFTDPRGAVTTNSWDALGRLLQRKSLDTDGVTQLAAEGFAYEPGGLVRYHTNALGGLAETRYASTGQPRFRQNADGSTNGWTYYLDGRIRREIQGNGAYAETTYADSLRSVTKTFYSAAGVPLATNIVKFDPRGNVVQQVDAGGNTFTNRFDGLNRIKIAAGPAIVSVQESPGSGVSVTNVYQQITTYTYSGSGKVVTVANALGENTVTTRDALGRVVSQQTFASNSVTALRVTTIAYAADHNSFTVTEGSGVNAISTTTYTDPDDRAVLAIAYPSATTRQITRLQYDLAGNLSANSQLSAINGTLTTWQTTLFSYDGLNRPHTLTERDNAVTTFSYDAAGNETNRALPGNLIWSATYNNAGQILTEKDSNGASNARNLAYAYYSTGNPWAGLLQTVTDGSGVTRTNSYDDYLRLAGMTTTGAQPEQQMSCSWQYEPRGFLTTIVQSFASTNTGPTTTIQRRFDVYGQLASENSTSQGWDVAGRRTQVGGISFQYRADGRMTAASGATFGYGDNGLLTGRTNSSRTVAVDQRDGMGRPLQATTRVNLSTVLTENWNWTGDGLPNSYTAARDFTDTRNFTYGALHRRLTQETLNLGSGSSVTNNYTFDNGVAAGLGVITKVGESQSNSWSGGLDSFSRVVNETNTLIHRIANGTVNGAATLRGYLNSQPIDLRYDSATASQWAADMNLQRGTNTLIVYADHPSGQFTTNKSTTFNVNSTASDNETSQYDGAGNVTNRVWKDSLGATVKTQTLTWDAFGRLVKVTERDPGNNGFNLVSVFDGLGRQVQTIETAVTNNVLLTSNPAPVVVNYTYDPQVEFLMIGIGVSQGNGARQDSLTYGPDISGGYGGMQGVGGLETITSGALGVSAIAINDAFGNVIAAVTNGVAGWNAARVNLYGPMESYAPPRLSLAAPTYASLAWRTRPLNTAGLVQLGARTYDPQRRAFLSADPLGHSSDPALNTAFGGNPAAYFDPDGRAGVSLFQMMFPATAIAAGARPWTGSIQGDIQYSRGAFAPFYMGAAVMGSPRVQGGFKVVGGSGEMVVGGTGVVATSPTIAGSIVSGAAVVHGADTVQSGWRQMMSGNLTPSYTSRGITALTGSQTVGELGDAGLGVALSLGSGLLTQGPRTGVAGGRVTQFFNPARGSFGPTSSEALSASQTGGLGAVLDGTALQTWVAPSAAQDMNWLQRLGTGRPFYNNYVEFDALAGELQSPANFPKSLLGDYQQVVSGSIGLGSRNPIGGILGFNYGAAGFLSQLGSGISRNAGVVLSKH